MCHLAQKVRPGLGLRLCYQKMPFCISCIETLVMHLTVEHCGICEIMFSGVSVHVLECA